MKNSYRDRLRLGYKAAHIRTGVPFDLNYEARVYAKTFGALIPKSKQAAIFELGCGSGGFLYYLAKEGYSAVSGMDLDPSHVEAAQRTGVKNVSAGDAVAHLAGRKEAYDCIVAIDALEHFTKDEIFPVLDAVLGALKPGGTFLWRAPNADGPFGMRIRYGDLTHELAFTKASAWQLLKAAEFEVLDILPETPVVTGLSSLARRLLWIPLSWLARLYLRVESCTTDALLTPNLIVRAQKPSR